jgi:hypothetical protein
MRTFLCSLAVCVASGITLVASGAAALPTLPRNPTVKLDRATQAVTPANERARSPQQAKKLADRYHVSIGRNVATNAKIPNVHATFDRATSRARACFLHAVQKDQTVKGFAAFRLTLAPDGSVDVIEAQTFSGSNLPQDVIDCTTKVLFYSKFEPPTDYEGSAIVVASATFGNVDPSVGPGPARATRQPGKQRPTPRKKIVRTHI